MSHPCQQKPPELIPGPMGCVIIVIWGVMIVIHPIYGLALGAMWIAGMFAYYGLAAIGRAWSMRFQMRRAALERARQDTLAQWQQKIDADELRRRSAAAEEALRLHELRKQAEALELRQKKEDFDRQRRIASMEKQDADREWRGLLAHEEEQRIQAAVEAALAKDRAEREKAAPAPKLSPDEAAALALVRYQAAIRRLDAAGLDPVELDSAKKKAKAAYLRELGEGL